MIEWPIIAAMASLIIATLTLITFWINLNDKIAKAEARAAAAESIAQDARKFSTEINTSLAATTAAFALYREQIAKEYIHRESMREIEDRLTGEIKELGKRIDTFMFNRPRGSS